MRKSEPAEPRRLADSASCPAIKDTGWTAVCPSCTERWRNDPKLIGKERWVDFVECPECKKYAAKNHYRQDVYGSNTARGRGRPKKDIVERMKEISQITT